MIQRKTTDTLISPVGWIWLAVITILFGLFFHTILRRSLNFAIAYSNEWSHIPLIPLISMYYVFQNKEQLMQTARRLYWPGLLIVFFGLFGYAWWIYPGRNDMFQGYSLILTLFGVVLFLLGPRMMGILWFPIFYLVFSVRISQKLWDSISWNLQWIAAMGAAFMLKLIGVFIGLDAHLRGSTIDLIYGNRPIEPLNIAEACSGLRMLMAFLALGVAMAFLFNRRWWQRLVMILMAVPIALFINVLRVTALGLISLYDNSLIHGDFHIFIGMTMLVPAAGLFLLLGWILDHIIIYEEPNTDHSDSTGGIHQTPYVAAYENMPAFNLKNITKGLTSGVVLTLVIGAIYILGLASFRPDVFSNRLPASMLYSLLIFCIILLIPLVVYLPKLFSGQYASRLQGASSLVVGLLLMATLGQNTVIAMTEAVLIKKKVPPRKWLTHIPTKVDHWKMVNESEPLSPDEIKGLGTEMYISRFYVDTTVNDIDEKDFMRGRFTPGSIIRLHIAYYTGTPDTVPHVPQQCYVAGGRQPLGIDTVRLNLCDTCRPDPDSRYVLATTSDGTSVRLPRDHTDATVFSYMSPERRNSTEHVTYFFVANGKFLVDQNAVRLHGFDPRDEYSYYCKVEVLPWLVSDSEISGALVESFLKSFMPEIMACLPDWVEVEQGRWPKNNSVHSP